MAAQQLEDGLPHVLAGERVDDRVEEGVDYRRSQEVFGLIEHVAASDRTEEVQQEEGEQRKPARNENPQDDGDGLQQRHVLLGLAVKAFPLWHRGEALGVGLDDAEDAHVQHHDGEEDGAEDGDAEEDVAFGVERQNGGALIQLSDAVPPQDGQDPQEHGEQPTGSDQQEHPTLFVPLVRLHPHHGDMAFDGDGQQTDDRSRQHDEHTPLPQEIQHGGHAERVSTRRYDVYHVGETCEQVGESQTAQ